MSSQQSEELALTGQLEYVGSIGTGDVFVFRIHSASRDLGEEAIRLTVLASDHARSQFIYAHRSPALLQATFRRGASEQPTAAAIITGFVDREGTVWGLIDLRLEAS